MQVKLKGHTIVAEWTSGEITDPKLLRQSLLVLPHARSVTKVNETSLEVTFHPSRGVKQLLEMVLETLKRYSKPSQRGLLPPTIDIHVSMAQNLLKKSTQLPKACFCDPTWSGEEYCTGACEARAMLAGVKLLQALQAVLTNGVCARCYAGSCSDQCICPCHEREAHARYQAKEVLDTLGC